MKILQKENHTAQNCSQNQAKTGIMVFFFKKMQLIQEYKEEKLLLKNS